MLGVKRGDILLEVGFATQLNNNMEVDAFSTITLHPYDVQPISCLNILPSASEGQTIFHTEKMWLLWHQGFCRAVKPWADIKMKELD